MGFVRILSMLALSAMTLAACGSDDDEGSTGGNSEALGRCNQYCDASAGKDCQLVDAPTCKQICSALMQSVSADCAAKHKASYDCQLAQADICASDPCQAQMSAASNCM